MLLRFSSSVRGATIQKKFETRTKEIPNTLKSLRTIDEIPLQRMPFKIPTLEEQLESLGPDPPSAFLKFEDFRPIPRPKSGDWLASHDVEVQSFSKFIEKRTHVPDAKRSTIYIQPIGKFKSDESPSLELIASFVGVFYSLPAKVLPPILNPNFKKRNNHGVAQYKTGDILAYLKQNLPADAFCVLGVSMTDLYPEDDWNFVFGQASLVARVGVFSFARYDPVFYGESRDKDYMKLLLWRSLRVVVHEIGHMFGIKHCTMFSCLMQGSNHLQESDSRPMHFCPICLRKLQSSTGFEVTKHYKDVYTYLIENGYDNAAKWYQTRLEHIV